MTFIPTELVVKSVGSLDQQVEKELQIPDPDPVQAAQAIQKAQSEDNEDTKRND